MHPAMRARTFSARLCQDERKQTRFISRNGKVLLEQPKFRRRTFPPPERRGQSSHSRALTHATSAHAGTQFETYIQSQWAQVKAAQSAYFYQHDSLPQSEAR